jgi:hypothetical protein
MSSALKDAPSLRTSLIRRSPLEAARAGTTLELPQAVHLLQHVLQELLPADDVDVPLDLGVFAREALDVCLRQGSPEARVELSRELEQFSAEDNR